MKSALIIGANGVIGRAISAHLRNQSVTVFETTRATLDLSTPQHWPDLPYADVVYPCAAITKLDECENHPAETRRINVKNLQLLCERLFSQQSHLVFLSSNQVFDGNTPFQKPEAKTNPKNEYGRQKAEMEQWLLSQKNTSVLRLTKVIASPPPILAQWKEALLRGETIEAFSDLIFAPLPLSAVINALGIIGANRLVGILQLSGTADMSYYDMAKLLANSLGLHEDNIRATRARENGIRASFLPAYGSLKPTPPLDLLDIPPANIVVLQGI